MKKNYKQFLQRRLTNKAVCLLALATLGVANASAQTQEEKDAVAVYNKRKAESEKAKKQETLKAVTGKIVDNATGEALGGVRVQAFGHDRFSTLTEEDGTFTIEVPTYVNSLFVNAPGYNS
ncbi:MAG: carboxypeptidase-like regulatory domain-containing protein, partial [Bacteroidaceae bacterium]|nr:carboxypeptidase-like regulatory domain-containing protein [Bacteroidaceae bacterium]